MGSGPRTAMSVFVTGSWIINFHVRVRDWALGLSFQTILGLIKYDSIYVLMAYFLAHIIFPQIPGKLFEFRGSYNGLIVTQVLFIPSRVSSYSKCGATYTFIAIYVLSSVLSHFGPLTRLIKLCSMLSCPNWG